MGNMESTYDYLERFISITPIDEIGTYDCSDILSKFRSLYSFSEHNLINSASDGDTIRSCFNNFLVDNGIQWFDIMYIDPFSEYESELKFFSMFSISDELVIVRDKVKEIYQQLDVEENVKVDIFQSIINNLENSLGLCVNMSVVDDNSIKSAKSTKEFILDLDSIKKINNIAQQINNQIGNTDYAIIKQKIKLSVNNIIPLSNDLYPYSEKDFIYACLLNKIMFYNDVWSFLYMFPILSSGGKKLGRVSFVSNRRIDSYAITAIRYMCNIILSPFITEYVNFIKTNKIQKESIKSAISAIMARNMSHNLGSHFISNTKNYFGQLADNENENDQRRRDYRGIKHTLQYIQERMDFIATIVSSDKFPYGPVNVKSQIFDELTPDEFGCRHEKETTNFLLDFLVYSEAISKCTNEEYSSNKVRLTLNLITKDDKTGKLYRFGAIPQGEDQEAREIFAKRNLAVPGGVLGRHALFTIIENVIRNSSKHDKKNIPGSGLNVSVRLNIVDNDASNIVIFDNKGNAEKVKDNIFKLYQETQILDENGSIDKGNKGLKEILIATLWLNNVNLAEWLAKYDSLKNNYDDKLQMLSQYLEIVTVDENGEETVEASHLGYKIKIKPFNSVQRIHATENNFILYNDIADVNADIITADKDYYVLTHEKEHITDKTPKLSFIFPRFVESKDVSDPVFLMKKSLVNRGLISEDTLNNISIDIVPRSQSIKSICKPAQYNIYNNDSGIVNPLAVKIIYKSHLSIDETEIKKTLDRYPNANYIDSISGGDFTHTLTEEFFLSDELNRLKIIESALCKVVIVDERIFNNYAHGQMPQDKSQEVVEEVDWSKKVNEILETIKDLKQGKIPPVKIVGQIKDKYGISLSVRDILSEKVAGHILDVLQKPGQSNETEVKAGGDHEFYHKFLEKKGIYIYNILPATGEIITPDGRSMDLKSGTKIINSPTFLSIHLSLIEGLIKERQISNPGEERSTVVRAIMDRLKICFGNPKFMMVHSGRGNLSKELEDELKDKAFMSLSAIEASLYDSKYFLSQLLCSNCYFGKGKINL